MIGYLFDRRRRAHLMDGYPASVRYQAPRFTDLVDRVAHYHGLGFEEVPSKIPATAVAEWGDALMDIGYAVGWGPMPGGHPGARLSTFAPRSHHLEDGAE